MLHEPAYRLRLYAPRSVDPTEATVLTPAAGAPHSDAFQVASIAGVAGYQPYLQALPMGRRGRIDLLSRKLDVGTLQFTLIDKRLPDSDNLTRWWTAFWGDSKGKPSGRLRMEADESLDAGATWDRFATMELVGSQITGKNQVALSFRDRVELLKMKLFVGQPSASLSYVAHPTLCPIGFRGASYGSLEPTAAMTGTAGLTLFGGTTYQPSGEIFVRLDPPGPAQTGINILTRNLAETLGPDALADVAENRAIAFAGLIPNYGGLARCHLKRLDTSAEGDFRVGALLILPVAGRAYSRIHGFYIDELAAGDVGHMAVPPGGTDVEIHLYLDGPISEKRPLLIGDVDPAQYIQDICAGRFGYLYRSPDTLPAGKSYGDPMRTIAVNTDTGTAGCVSDLEGTRPPMRLPVTKPSTAQDEIERVCLENHWAPFLDKEGQLNVVDLRLPNTLAGIPTLTDADVDNTEDADWKHDPTQAILRLELTQYSDSPRHVADLATTTERYPTVASTTLIEEMEHKLEPIYIGSIDHGDRVLQIPARGYRSMSGEESEGQPRGVYLANKLFELAHLFQRPFAYGLTTIPLPCRRTATVTGLTQGALVICDVDVVPDPATHVRGGARVCRVLELTEDGPLIRVLLADLSFAAVAAAPAALGAPAQETGNTMTGVTVAVTLNASNHPAEISYAVTETSEVSAPAEDSPLWSVAGYQTADRGIITPRRRRPSGGGPFAIRGLPPGKRIWVRGRSVPQDNVEPQFPSPYVAAAAPGYVDTATLGAPSGLSATHTDKVVTLSWTNASDDVDVEVRIASPVSDPRRRVALLDPGSTSHEVRGVEPSTTYRFGVRHAIGDLRSAEVTVDVTTDATGPAAPDILAFDILDVRA